jgi:hypothetical protein
VEAPYVQLFFYQRDHSQWLEACGLDCQTLAVFCRGPSSEHPNLPEQQDPEGTPRSSPTCKDHPLKGPPPRKGIPPSRELLTSLLI